MQINDRKFEELKSIWKRWLILLVWLVAFLVITQNLGIVVHELGHYGAGKFFGCENLSISIAKISWEDSISSVSGWESCSRPLVIKEDGSRICNISTNIVSFSGLFLTLIVLIPLIFLLNNLLKKRVKKHYLEGRYLILISIFVIFTAIKSAIFDLFEIMECLSNTFNAEILFKIINLLPKIIQLIILLFFFIEFIRIIKLLQVTK